MEPVRRKAVESSVLELVLADDLVLDEDLPFVPEDALVDESLVSESLDEASPLAAVLLLDVVLVDDDFLSLAVDLLVESGPESEAEPPPEEALHLAESFLTLGVLELLLPFEQAMSPTSVLSANARSVLVSDLVFLVNMSSSLVPDVASGADSRLWASLACVKALAQKIL